MSHEQISRRDVMRAAGVVAAGAVLGQAIPAVAQEQKEKAAVEKIVVNGRIKQSASVWCYGKVKFEELCAFAQQIGMKGLDLLGPGQFATLKKYGLVCTMINTHGIGEGFNKKANHAKCLDSLRKAIEAAAEYGFPNVITFSGNRDKDGPDDAEGARNCIEGLKQIMSFAEEKKVTICMELLNSKRNHKGYMCDRTAWGAEVCKGVGSPRMKLLYDIYHMQIMEGDIIATLHDFKDYIGHVHTGGVPGRNEIDETQELYHPPIMKALLDIKYDGYVAHEFIPKHDPLTSLAAAVKLCDI